MKFVYIVSISVLALSLLSGCTGETKIIYSGLQGHCEYTAYSYMAKCYDNNNSLVCSYEYYRREMNGHWC